MAIQFKQRCQRCKTNFVLANNRSRFIVCYECQKKEMSGEVTDPEMKKMFNIPEEYYKESFFLRDIKVKYLRFGNLSENQINAFKKVVDEMKLKEKEEEKCLKK